MEIVIMERVKISQSYNKKIIGKSFFLPLTLLDPLVLRKKKKTGHIIPYMEDGVTYTTAGCDISIDGETIEIDKIDRADPELVATIKAYSGFRTGTPEFNGIVWKVVEIPDGVDYSIESDRNNEIVFWEKKEEGDEKEIFVYQDVDSSDRFNVPDEILDTYLSKIPLSERIHSIHEGKKVPTQLFRVNKNSVVTSSDIYRKSHRFIEALREKPNKKFQIKKIAEETIQSQYSDSTQSFEIVVPLRKK